MPFYFIGQEDHDFTKIGGCTVDTATTAARRSAYARCSLKVGLGAATTDGYQGALSTAVSLLHLTGRFYAANDTNNTACDIVALNDGVTRRLALTLAAANGAYRLVKIDAAGTRTTLATASVNLAYGSLQKLDVYVSYAVAGQVKVYLDGTLIIDYSGDVTTNSASTLSSFVLGQVGRTSAGGGAQYTAWSEVICGTDDTRSMSLCTLPPAANGNAFAWTGSFSDLNEVTLNDATLSTSATSDQLLQTTVTSIGLAGTPAIRALCVSARASKGGTGPQNIQMNVRTGSNDYFSSTLALPAALDRVANIFATNPATSGPWAHTDLTAAGFNIGAKSIT